MIWPDAPASVSDGELVERALAADGVPVVHFAPLRAALDRYHREAEDAERQALDAVEAGLAAARTAYLDQQFDVMIAQLLSLESAHIATLAQPRHGPVLWEISFQLAVGYQARGRAGDDAKARSRFALAQALVPDKRPLRELYGPRVLAGFAEVLGEQASTPVRPVRVRIDPADATVVVDGAQRGAGQTGAARSQMLRPGLHVVYAAAPGYVPYAAVTQLAGDAVAGGDGARGIEIVLTRRDAGTALERIGPDWGAGALWPERATGRALIVAAAAAAGAKRVVVLGREDGASGRVSAQVIAIGDGASGDGGLVTGGATGVVTSVDPAEAARAALRAAFLSVADGSGAGASRAWWRQWWVWTAVGAVATSAVVWVVSSRDSTTQWQISVPVMGPWPRPVVPVLRW